MKNDQNIVAKILFFFSITETKNIRVYCRNSNKSLELRKNTVDTKCGRVFLRLFEFCSLLAFSQSEIMLSLHF